MTGVTNCMVQSVAGDAGYHVTRYNNFWYGRILIVSGVPRGVWGFNRPPPKFQRPSKIVPNVRILTVSGVPRGFGGFKPPEIPKALQNCAKRKNPVSGVPRAIWGFNFPPKFRSPSKIVPNGRILTVSGVPRGVKTPRNSEGPRKSCQTQPDCENC